MVLSHRQKVAIIPLVLYWPGIFILTHIPTPKMFIRNFHTFDKTLHYITYFILVFLLWFVISPERKASWRRAALWWVIFIVAVYGAADEWLQGYVNRTPDVMDFLADLAGAFTGLFVLAVFSFWPACLALVSGTLFMLTNFMQAVFADQIPAINIAFHIFGYFLFTLLWIQYMSYLFPIKAPQFRWLFAALVVPIVFLFATETFSALANDGFMVNDLLISLAGIAFVVAVNYLIALFRMRQY